MSTHLDLSTRLDQDNGALPATQNLGAASASKQSFSWDGFRQTKLYDLLAASPFILWYFLCVSQQVPTLKAKFDQVSSESLDLHYVFSTLSQTAVTVFTTAVLIFFLLRIPAKARARGLIPAIVAIAGTYFGLSIVFLPKQDIGLVMSIVSFLLIIDGVALAIYGIMYLGRSFSVLTEARRLVTTGPYALVRHPLYLGEAIAMVGIMLQYFSPLAVAIVGLQLMFQFQRMKNEEKILLSLYPEYADYAARTARLIPGVY